MAAKGYSGAGQPRTMRLLAMVLPILSRLHVIVYRGTGGIVGGRIAGTQILLLTTIGRKTGQPRTTPVAYLNNGYSMFIIGGAAGAAKHPDWWLNLRAQPQAQIQVGWQKLQVSAAPATAEEQQRLWARYPAQQALFDSMRQQVSREIPVVVLRRKGQHGVL